MKTSSLGDIVLGLQVANALKAADPWMSLSWVSRRRFQRVVEASQLVDRVFTFYRSGSVYEFFGLLKELRRERFDFVLDMQGLARSALMSFAARSPRKVGRADAREGATLFYNRIVPLPAKGSEAHAVEILYQFCRVFGIEPRSAGRVPFRTRDLPREGEALLARGGRRVALFPGKERQGGDWPGYFELAEGLLQADSNMQVVLAGLHASELPERLSRMANGRLVDIRGRTRLDESLGIIERSDLVVSNEVAPIQMAVAMGRSTLGLYGPVDPSRYGPRPCDRGQHGVLRADSGNLEDVPVAAALSDALWLLDKSSS